MASQRWRQRRGVAIDRQTEFGNRGKTRGVIAGLVPAISIGMAQVPDYRDGRDKPGHDQVGLPRLLPLLQNL
jgi:hypothetical protein